MSIHKEKVPREVTLLAVDFEAIGLKKNPV